MLLRKVTWLSVRRCYGVVTVSCYVVKCLILINLYRFRNTVTSVTERSVLRLKIVFPDFWNRPSVLGADLQQNAVLLHAPHCHPNAFFFLFDEESHLLRRVPRRRAAA